MSRAPKTSILRLSAATLLLLGTFTQQQLTTAKSLTQNILNKAGQYCDPHRRRPDGSFQLGVGEVTPTDVLRVHYKYYFPDGKQLGLGGSGGCAFNTDFEEPSSAATLKYSVFVPKGFPLVSMGKFPGLLGSSRDVKDLDNYDCVGGNNKDYCFSVRIMWKLDPKSGSVNVYPYVYTQAGHVKALCPDYAWDCPDKYGTFLKMNGLQLKEGAKNDIALSIDTKHGRGKVSLTVNGVTKTMDNVPLWLTGPAQPLRRVLHSVHIGGKKETWPKAYFDPNLKKNPLYMEFSDYELKMEEEDGKSKPYVAAPSPPALPAPSSTPCTSASASASTPSPSADVAGDSTTAPSKSYNFNLPIHVDANVNYDNPDKFHININADIGSDYKNSEEQSSYASSPPPAPEVKGDAIDAPTATTPTNNAVDVTSTSSTSSPCPSKSTPQVSPETIESPEPKLEPSPAPVIYAPPPPASPPPRLPEPQPAVDSSTISAQRDPVSVPVIGEKPAYKKKYNSGAGAVKGHKRPVKFRCRPKKK